VEKSEKEPTNTAESTSAKAKESKKHLLKIEQSTIEKVKKQEEEKSTTKKEGKSHHPT